MIKWLELVDEAKKVDFGLGCEGPCRSGIDILMRSH